MIRQQEHGPSVSVLSLPSATQKASSDAPGGDRPSLNLICPNEIFESQAVMAADDLTAQLPRHHPETSRLEHPESVSGNASVNENVKVSVEKIFVERVCHSCHVPKGLSQELDLAPSAYSEITADVYWWFLHFLATPTFSFDEMDSGFAPSSAHF